MIIVLKSGATQDQIDNVAKKLEEYGFQTHISQGTEKTIIGAIGDERALRDRPLSAFPGVEKVLPIVKPYKLVGKLELQYFGAELSSREPHHTLFRGSELRVLNTSERLLMSTECSL